MVGHFLIFHVHKASALKPTTHIYIIYESCLFYPAGVLKSKTKNLGCIKTVNRTKRSESEYKR